MIRPRPARWFEILVARDDATLALEALAGTGAVELEARPTAVLPAALADIRPLLQQYAEFSLRYRAYWPAEGRNASAFPEAPVKTLERCLAHLRAWALDAEPVIQQLQRGESERAELARWSRVLEAMATSTVDFAQTVNAGPLVHVRLFVFPPDSEPAFPQGLLVRHFVADGQLHALAVGTSDELLPLVQQAAAMKGQVHEMPSWLHTDMARNEAYVAARKIVLEHEDGRLRAELAALDERHGLRTALGDAARLHWVVQNVRALESGDLFCRITGWTSELAGHRLASALDRSGARAILHHPPPPSGAKPPLLLANPWWARPFEVFSRALGMPSRNEADPSVLLALAVPLMFGFMFADVGQGLVIAIAGFALRKRWPLARLFVAGGISATLFGLLFGSVFSLHVFHPLWLAPLENPLTILLVPIIGGGILLTIGLLLSAVEALWRGEFAGWVSQDAGFIAVYLGLLSGFLWKPGFAVAAGGAALFCLGHAWHARRVGAIGGALAELVERTLQILINTLSFARVGAFALAHAGLSSAIVALMHASGNVAVAALVLVLGNAIVIVLEGLVVSIQTTRLVLFEFFTRFLAAEGRVFRPLPAPPSTSGERP
jgi:V/A-type H+/Na+-transporting ATPase subunit I